MFNKSFGAPFGGGTGGFGTSSSFGQQNTGFGAATGGFGASAFGATNNTGGLFGATQNKPVVTANPQQIHTGAGRGGGLFGSSTFSQPVTSSTSSNFGFGAATGTSTSLFGSTNTGGGGLFSQQSNAFGAAKPTSFSTFGQSTASSGGLFGATNTNSSPFGGATASLFGASGFTQQATQPGTTVKFNPPSGSDTMVKGGVTTSINTKHQCITAMKEYENKSLEELRLEDYQAGRKGPTNPMAAPTGGLFGVTAPATPSTGAAGLFGSSATSTGFSFGQAKTSFGAGGFGAATGSLFGQQPAQQAQQAASLFKPFGQATTTPNTGFSFGNTSTMGQPQQTSTMVCEVLTYSRLQIYVDHLKLVKADLEIRFRDLLDLDVPIWVVQPFQADVGDCELAIQEHLVEIQCDVEAQATFRTFGWGSMWAKYATRYPALWEKTRPLLFAFPSTNLVEQGYSQVLRMQSQYRKRLDLMASGALRLKLTSLQPAVKELAKKNLTKKHLTQGSQ